MRRSVSVSLVLVGVATTGLLLLRDPITRAFARTPAGSVGIVAEADASAGAVRELKAQLQALRSQVGSLQGQLARQSSDAKPTADDAETLPLKPDARPELTADEAEDLWAAHMAEVAMNFENEPRAPAWATERRAQIQNAVKGRSIEQALGDVECRADTCRVEVTDNRKSEFAKELPVFLQQLGGELPTVEAAHFPEPDGSIKLVLYMSRFAVSADDN